MSSIEMFVRSPGGKIFRRILETGENPQINPRMSSCIISRKQKQKQSQEKFIQVSQKKCLESSQDERDTYIQIPGRILVGIHQQKIVEEKSLGKNPGNIDFSINAQNNLSKYSWRKGDLNFVFSTIARNSVEEVILQRHMFGDV